VEVKESRCDGVSAPCTARIQLSIAGNGWLHNALQYHTSRQLVAFLAL